MILRSTDIRKALRARQRGFILNPYNFAPAGDPNFANVSLLLHCDGTNGSTVFTDSSTNSHVPTVNGNAQISTAQSRFGGSSGLFDGAGDYLGYASNAAFGFGTGNYTVEGWVRFTSTLTDRCVFDTRIGVSPFTGLAIYVDQSAANFGNRLGAFHGITNLAPSNTTQFAASSNFQHWAVCRSGTTVRGFINGALVWTGTSSASVGTSSPLQIGAAVGPGQFFNGYLDEIRVTKGVARYTAAFTPPAAPFPNM